MKVNFQVSEVKVSTTAHLKVKFSLEWGFQVLEKGFEYESSQRKFTRQGESEEQGFEKSKGKGEWKWEF